MEKKIYLSLLTLWALFSQGIGTLSEKKMNETSNLHIRTKRVINKSPNGNRPVPIEQVYYIVNILKNRLPNCGGSILDAHIIITAAHCFLNKHANYSILSGKHFALQGTHHNIEQIIPHPYYNPEKNENDLALLIIFPPIDFVNSPNRKIGINTAYIRPMIYATFSGWGCTHWNGNRWVYPNELRSTLVPVLSQRQCQNEYGNTFRITDKEICTLDINQEKCGGDGDSGGPLVINGKLIGVYSWSGGYNRIHRRIFPDIFMKLSHPLYHDWINSFIERHG